MLGEHYITPELRSIVIADRRLIAMPGSAHPRHEGISAKSINLDGHRHAAPILRVGGNHPAPGGKDTDEAAANYLISILIDAER